MNEQSLSQVVGSAQTPDGAAFAQVAENLLLRAQAMIREASAIVAVPMPEGVEIGVGNIGSQTGGLVAGLLVEVARVIGVGTTLAAQYQYGADESGAMGPGAFEKAQNDPRYLRIMRFAEQNAVEALGKPALVRVGSGVHGMIREHESGPAPEALDGLAQLVARLKAAGVGPDQAKRTRRIGFGKGPLRGLDGIGDDPIPEC